MINASDSRDQITHHQPSITESKSRSIPTSLSHHFGSFSNGYIQLLTYQKKKNQFLLPFRKRIKFKNKAML